jgi:CRP/FNR family cyclic AMP-dependent transcriptional regulator
MRMKDHRTARDRLRKVTLFSACEDAELDVALESMTQAEFPAGHVLAQQGRVGREFLVVVEGNARVTIDEREIAVLGPGDFFGEMALLDGGPRTATVVAITDVVVDVMTHQEFDRVLNGSPHVARAVLTGLARRLREADVQLAAHAGAEAGAAAS